MQSAIEVVPARTWLYAEATTLGHKCSPNESRKQRRKLQNRVNQRSYRRRQRLLRNNALDPIQSCLAIWSMESEQPLQRNGACPVDVQRDRTGASHACKEVRDQCLAASPRLTDGYFSSFRKDPFNCFPHNAPYIPQIADFFFEVFALPYVWRPELVKVAALKDLSGHWFRAALQDEVLFEAFVALNLACLLAIRENRRPSPSKEVLYHHSEALALLRVRLTTGQEPCNDAVVLPILSLMAIDYFYGNIAAVRTHLRGLRRILKWRKQSASSFWDPFIATRVSTFESLCKSYSTHTQRFDRLTALAYPTHPFDVSLCEDISSLPPGLERSCLSGGLSYQVIDLICHAVHWSDEMHQRTQSEVVTGDGNIMEPNLCAGLLANSALLPLEQYICVAIMAYHFDAFNSKPMQAITWYSMRPPKIAAPTPSMFCDEETRECLLWVAMVLEAIAESSMNSLFEQYRREWNLLPQILEHEPALHAPWPVVEPRVEAFLWSDIFTGRVERRWAMTMQQQRSRVSRGME